MAIPKVLEGRLRIPVIGSPLFIISSPELVLAQCKAGIVGSFPSLNARPLEQLDEWLLNLNSELTKFQEENPDAVVAPYAVNLICHKSNGRLYEDVDLLVKHEVPIVITSLRAPADLVEKIHSYGGIVLHDVTNIRHAKKAVEEGVDGLILVCAGAGGHAGELSPFALTREVREFYDGTVLLAGAMSSGRDVAAALAMGADMAYMGTRFIATSEARAKPQYKQTIVDSSASEIVYSDFELTPILVGDASPEDVSNVLNLLWDAEHSLFVISTDLSHFLPYEHAKALDKKTCLAIENCDGDAILYEQACGRLPVQGMLKLAKQHELKVHTLDLRNSGDTAGPRDQVVGYGSWILVKDNQ